MPGYGFIKGMYAFGLEEAGEYEQAEAHGREAAELNAQDGWAVHAVTHVMEMQGRAAEGARFLEAGVDGWAPNSMFAFHLWWHKALFHLDTEDPTTALKLFDDKISAGGFGQALELLDGSALLWRLHLLGHDVGDRWVDLAGKWGTRADDAYYAFNDVNAMMSREIGVPACEGFAAFGRGDYALTIEWLMPLRGKANRFGGSHAQRDMFSWTLTEAAIRSGDVALADALVAERLSWKPDSPINHAWAMRAGKLRAVPAA
jgi:hypothetical protein